jgi:hypothetical protein
MKNVLTVFVILLGLIAFLFTVNMIYFSSSSRSRPQAL